MKNIAHYLEKKLKNFSVPQKVIRDTFIDVVYEVCEIRLKNHEVSVSGDTVFVTTNPVVKNEIMLQRGPILSRLKSGLLGQKRVNSIR